MGSGPGFSSMEVHVKDSSAHRLSTQLERCQEQPIQVAIGDLSSVEIANVLSILCSNNRASSWSHISMPMSGYIFDCLRPYTGLFTGLRCLHLEGVMANDTEVDLDVFQNAPALVTVSIWGENSDYLDDLKLPWSQITHYTARDSQWFFVSNSFHFTTLRRLENLQVCWLDCVIAVSDNKLPASNPPILLPYLHTLTLSCSEPETEFLVEGLPQLIGHVTLPALHTLRLRNGLYDTLDPLLHLVERSGCRLHDLTLCALHSGDEEGVLSLMKSGLLKNVQRLWIGWRFEYESETTWRESFDLRLLPPLVRTPDEDYLPNLQYFQTNISDMDDTLITIVESRRSTGGRALEYLVLQDHGGWAPERLKKRRAESKERFRELCDRGLRLEWRGPDSREG
ncbi:hypothetical protein PQX77_011230 [Marasmius sp. AFHP31]|nr:hypothetical protein PQX77_011230 [Marasmius sp. AFHP31]